MITYIACPYSHTEAKIREQRVEVATSYAAHLVRQGKVLYSPLTHSHPITERGVGIGWDAWSRFDLEFLAVCREVIVLALPEWETSVGVQAEVREALAAEKRVWLQPIDFRLGVFLGTLAVASGKDWRSKPPAEIYVACDPIPWNREEEREAVGLGARGSRGRLT